METFLLMKRTKQPVVLKAICPHKHKVFLTQHSAHNSFMSATVERTSLPKASLGSEKIVLILPRSIKAGPIIISVMSRYPLMLLFKKSQLIYLCIMLFVLKQIAIRRHESAFMCLWGYKPVLRNPYTQREAWPNSLSITYADVAF